MSIHASINGEIKKIKNIYVNINGEKRKVISGWVNKNGSPAKIYSSINIDLSDILIDFTYVVESDGTHVLKAWKGTYNGEPSTIMAIPDNEYIRIE